MIVFDRETRLFSVVEEQREFNAIHTAALNAGGSIITGAGKRAGRVIAGNDRKRTLWGRISGKNKALDREDQMRHEEQMARIQAGTDNRSLLRERLSRRDDRADKKLESKERLKMREMDSKDLGTQAKYGYKAAKLGQKPGSKTTIVPWKKRI